MFIYRKARPKIQRICKSDIDEKGKNALQHIQDMLKKHEKKIIAGLLFLWLTEEDDISEDAVSSAMNDNKKSDDITESYESYLYDFVDDVLQPEMESVGEEAFRTVYEDNQDILHVPSNQDISPKPLPTVPPPIDNPNDIIIPDTNQFDYRAFYDKWCDERAANMVTDLNDTQRQNVKDIINTSLTQGNINPGSVTRRIRDTVGLTSKQLERNQKYYNNMVNTLRENNPKLSDKEIEERAEEAAKKLANKQRADRAKSIARTELNKAHNQAAYSYVQWAIEHGYMRNVLRRWVTSGNDNVCAICFALNGQTVPFYEPYTVPQGINFKGEVILGPPVHTNCCCSEEFIEGNASVQNPPSQWDSMTEAEKKAHLNYYSDKQQFKEYKKRLGKENMPKTLEEFQQMKYNNNEEWERLQGLYKGIGNGTVIQDAVGRFVKILPNSGLHYKPNSITQVVGKKGGITRNFYDDNGNQYKQISNNGHNHKKEEAMGMHGEHAHDYDFNFNPPHLEARELTDDERKENADIL